MFQQPSRPAAPTVLAAVTVFLSAALLFLLEPLIAKRILPWFGGSAAVWSTCLVFYQSALLLGYLYARLLTRLAPRTQAALHTALLALSIAFLPIGPTTGWTAPAASNPAWLILAMLTSTIGLPFVLLSASSPLLQAWLARRGHAAPYRFFALSNFASLAALLSYPLLVEPILATSTQIRLWSVCYAAFALLCALAACLLNNGHSPGLHNSLPPRATAAQAYEWISPWRAATWFSLSACGSVLLLSVTNHINQNIAAVPLLWVLPLTLYLLSFVLAFGAKRRYRRALWLRLLAFALATLAYAIYNLNAVQAIQIALPIFLAALFICCFFCHAELHRLRPAPSNLTAFYLVIAAGGAAGGLCVGLLAPYLFSGVYELPLALLFTALLAAFLTWTPPVYSSPAELWPARLLWIGVSACMALVVGAHVAAYRQDTLSLRRSFYGSLRVVQSPHAGPTQTRTLYNGVIEHGSQFVLPPGRSRPTTYYGPDSGVGIVLREAFPAPERVGVIGLGIGTVAAYGRPGDLFRFYELNPQVIDIAQSLFFYLRESRAEIQIVPGDARLSLQSESTPTFHVLILDAFSGDAIPIHLLTREALALYLRHLEPNGVLAFHVSNNFLDLAPVIAQLAQLAGFHALHIANSDNPSNLILAADWVLVTNNPNVLENSALRLAAVNIPSRAELDPWTDNYNNLLEILKTPSLR